MRRIIFLSLILVPVASAAVMKSPLQWSDAILNPHAASLYAQQPAADPLVGNWRGTVQASADTTSPIVLSIVKRGAEYAGTTGGLADGGDAPFRKFAVTGNQVSVEAVADSRLGTVTLSAELTVEGNTMKGAGQIGIGAQRFPITLTLQRRPRADVVQHQVEQRPDYFVGRWKFDYLGGEFPPLSDGARNGTVTFTKVGASQFVTGKVEGNSYGKAYTETISIGVSNEAKALVFNEKRSDGIELTSVGDWHSPLAIVFETAPLVSGGKTYQLRRAIQVLSDTSFTMTEEFSVDGGPFKRLGQGRYSKQP